MQLPAGSWSHLTVHYDGELLSIFINGALRDTVSFGSKKFWKSSAQPLLVGLQNLAKNELVAVQQVDMADAADDVRAFQGQIFSVRLMGVDALSEDEVRNFMGSHNRRAPGQVRIRFMLGLP
jgi:Concanavalin A-like lectin/glucanases superfamily